MTTKVSIVQEEDIGMDVLIEIINPVTSQSVIERRLSGVGQQMEAYLYNTQELRVYEVERK